MRFWSRAVDFIRKKNVGKYRPSLEFERLFGCGVDGNPQQVAWQHVAGELNTLKTALQGAGDCLSKSCFADSGHPLNEQVTAGEHRDQRQPDDIIFAANNRSQRSFQSRSARRRRGSCFDRHQADSTMQ